MLTWLCKDNRIDPSLTGRLVVLVYCADYALLRRDVVTKGLHHTCCVIHEQFRDPNYVP